MNKQQTRDEALELLKSVADSEDATAETKEKAGTDMIEMARVTDVEGTIESLIKAKGFSDCMVYISDDAVNVVVASGGLSSEQAAQINEIVISESGRDASSVHHSSIPKCVLCIVLPFFILLIHHTVNCLVAVVFLTR